MKDRLLLIVGVFALSCVIGPLLDQIHVIGGALSYAHPWLLGQAWWVGPQFGLAFAFICAVSLAAQHRYGSEVLSPTHAARIGQQIIWFLAAYLATGILWERPWLLAALLAAGLVVRVLSVRPDRLTIVSLLVLALAGSLYEAIVSSLPETFDYTLTGVLPVPIWLPLLYMHGAPLLRTFAKDATVALTRAPA
jgi:hypothetical protein